MKVFSDSDKRCIFNYETPANYMENGYALKPFPDL